MFNELLLSDDQSKISLFEYLLNQNDTTFKLSNLEVDLNISRFKLRSDIESINADLESIKQPTLFEITSGWLYPSDRLSHQILQALLTIYFKRSSYYPLIIETLFSKDDFVPLKKMQENYNWTNVAYSRNKKTLLNLINKNSTAGDYGSYRILLFNILFYFNEQLVLPIDMIKTFSKIQYTFNPNNDLNKTHQISLMLSITYYEVNNHSHFIKAEECWLTSSSKTIELGSEFSKEEDCYFTQFLMTENLFPLNEFSYTQFQDRSKFEYIYMLTYDEISPLLLENNEPSLVKKILLIISEMIFIAQYAHDFPETIHLLVPKTYFNEIYPSLTHALVSLFNMFKNEKLVGKNDDRLFLLICAQLVSSDLNLENIDPVSICVDFTGGYAINEWIRCQITNFVGLNLRLKNITAESADIYLGDFAQSNLKTEQIIWTKPPTPKDWYQFGQAIVQIKRKKLSTQKTNNTSKIKPFD
ncbi:hypothetical protein D3P96_08305 [Weissella viridescens]|uniref:Mga helix-turn-helix domain-containing protein n=1 Tax=Weissella viridescens TaxID=1629 RepID=A0A3P2R952_WEIVI|nr:hypothetical protein [Weissella viridescens]RRG17337.1 hypothetical protein D3P96_08305 [Weissella viridescens]